MALNYYAPLRLIRGLAPGMIERGDGHIINVATWRVLPESSPMFAVYNASKAALSAVSRVIDTEWGQAGVHSTTVYYPLVATPMIAPTRAYDGVAALTADEAADWMVTAARTRPIRIAPRKALALRALDVVAPRMLNGVLERETDRMNARAQPAEVPIPHQENTVDDKIRLLRPAGRVVSPDGLPGLRHPPSGYPVGTGDDDGGRQSREAAST